MSDTPDFTQLAADCRAFAQQHYEQLPNGVWRVKPQLLEKAYGGMDPHHQTVMGAEISLEDFFSAYEETIPFIRQAGIIRARMWERGRHSRTTILEFDDGNIGLLRQDENANEQPRWPRTLLFQPWWSVNPGLTNFEIMPFGFIPADHRSTQQPGEALGIKLNRFFDHLARVTPEDCGVPPAPKSNGYLFLPDGTPYQFDPGEGVKVWYTSDEVDAVNDLLPGQRRALYAGDAVVFQEMLEGVLGKPAPFSYMAGDKTKLDHFFPIPARLDAAVKAHQRAGMGRDASAVPDEAKPK